MNKFLSQSSSNGISSSDVKRMIDESCVTYDPDKKAVILDQSDNILYNLPNTACPGIGYVIASDPKDIKSLGIYQQSREPTVSNKSSYIRTSLQ